MASLKQNKIDIRAGIIEGFFGKPWDWESRLSGTDFLRDCSYQFYIYAPKSESFLRRRWREPIPRETLQLCRSLVHVRQDRVNTMKEKVFRIDVEMKRAHPSYL
jgi:hypothetical protein